ncbi:MAG TPA: hypothetical protein VGC65_11495 [Bacteroidia bacterium]|jgi:uncharacterized membrane protein
MNWLGIISVFLVSAVKFFFGGVPMALGLGFSHFQSITVTTLGGFTGVTIFVYTSDKLIAYFKEKAALKRAQHPGAPPTKKFTKKNRTIISVKRRFGVVGFSFLVPVFIPIPIGCFLAVRYFNDKQKIIRCLFAAVMFWAIVGAYLYKPLFDALRNYFL